MLGYIPGLIHAWYIIAKYPEDTDEPEETQYAVLSQGERGYYAPQQQGPKLQNGTGVREGARGQGRQQQQQPQQGYGYGAMGGGMRSPQQQQQQQQPGPSQGAGEAVPPSYQEAVKGDNKIQT